MFRICEFNGLDEDVDIISCFWGGGKEKQDHVEIVTAGRVAAAAVVDNQFSEGRFQPDGAAH